MLLMPAGRPDREDKLIRWRLRETRKQGLIEIDGGKQKEKDRENEVSGEKEQLVQKKKMAKTNGKTGNGMLGVGFK